MNIIKSKLTKINSNWNEYYFIKEFFQKKINFTDEVKTNYYGDLNNYLHDTLSLVKSFKKQTIFLKLLFYCKLFILSKI